MSKPTLAEIAGSLRDPATRCAFVFGRTMKACPKCRGFDIGFSTPIKLTNPLPDDAIGIMRVWAESIRNGSTPLEGTCRIMCRSCGHLGPAWGVAGRTAEDVGRDPFVANVVKDLWNSDKNKAEE